MNTMTAAGTASLDRAKEEANTLVYNYKKLRTAIGILGISLPFTTWLGALIIFQTKLQGSISGYYYTGTRDVFVGTLWAIGFFFLAYKGYNKREDWLGNLACLFAVGISIFPTTPELNATAAATRIGYIHAGSAACFFAITAVFAFQFTKSNLPKEALPSRKRNRNRVYKVCGTILAVSLVLIVVTAVLPATVMAKLAVIRPIFLLETIAILAFGVSWLVKGEAVMGDNPDTVSTPSLSTGEA